MNGHSFCMTLIGTDLSVPFSKQCGLEAFCLGVLGLDWIPTHHDEAVMNGHSFWLGLVGTDKSVPFQNGATLRLFAWARSVWIGNPLITMEP